MQLKFCGAAGTVTGSSHFLTLDNGFKILLDCGMYQGNEPEYLNFNRTFLFSPHEIDVLILSHAHIDHCGKLPKLVADGFNGRIYSTPATRDLTALLLLDSAHIQERESEFTNRNADKDEEESMPLYTAEDVAKTMEVFQSFAYNQWFNVHPDVDVLLKDSGHILGSASITLRIKRHGLPDIFIGFTADIGRPQRPILRDPDPMPPCDYLICESTYGNRLHEAAPEEKQRLLRIIKQTCIEQKGKLIIPAFSVGRTQEVVYMINQLVNENQLQDIPVFVDSPLAFNATRIFLLHPECFDKDILKYMITDPDPFGFNDLKYVRTAEDSKKINNMHGCVVISAAGMINAGRVKHHVFNAIEHPENTILIVGYAAENTPGGKLRRGDKTIRLFGKELYVNARIERMESFSAHGDYKEMTTYLRSHDKNKLRKIFLVHGDREALNTFKNHLISEEFMSVEIPKFGETSELG
jgi:metallo-beta-lactamase family protein